MTTALIPYRPKPSVMERILNRMAYWAWMLGIKRIED